MTDEQFAAFCDEHPDLSFEMTAEGDVVVAAPVGSRSGARNFEVSRQLGNWARENGMGIGVDSSTGFVLPGGARRSPDAAWTLRSRIEGLSKESQEGYWHLCPDFAIEVRSQSDRLPTLRAKMREYIENGAKLAWLIDPESRAVEIYRSGSDAERIEKAESIRGEGPVAGFVLDLRTVWDPFAR
jgi:Uma2 family endonuclease